jgi:PBSX family phage terminase large subunit
MPDIKLLPKQSIAWKYLTDNTTNEIAFGGSAGGAKSTLGCIWIVTMCLQYPGIRTLIGRTVLATLKQTTFKTLLEVLGTKFMGLSSPEHYVFNAQTNVVTFNNGSEIILKDLEDKPSDINKDSLGGLELTAVYIDEAVQISFETFSVLKSRIRFKLNEYNLIPKILLTSNPGQNWLMQRFFIPWEEGTLESNKTFIQSLPRDNPFLPESYIEMLNDLPFQQRERLLMGNWRYTDDISALFRYEDIVNCTFKTAPNPNDKKYISIDVARMGSDTSVAVVWVGLTIVEIVRYKKIDTVQLTEHIKELIAKHKIHPSQVIADSDGIGGALVDNIRCTSFVNNSTPLHKQNFANLKAQCYVKLSDMIKEGKVSINILDPSMVEELTQELLTVKLKDVDKDNKVQVISKDQQKKTLGKSPDISDAVMFRMYWEIKNSKSTGRYAISVI